jgi:hypothetical protein
MLKCVTSSLRRRVRCSNPGYCWERMTRKEEGKEVKARKEKEGRARSRWGQVDKTQDNCWLHWHVPDHQNIGRKAWTWDVHHDNKLSPGTKMSSGDNWGSPARLDKLQLGIKNSSMHAQNQSYKSISGTANQQQFFWELFIIHLYSWHTNAHHYSFLIWHSLHSSNQGGARSFIEGE